MLKIQRLDEVDVVFRVGGRLTGENVGEISSLLAEELTDRYIVLDLKDVILADRASVHFLRACERDGIALRNCPPYIREWIEREKEQP